MTGVSAHGGEDDHRDGRGLGVLALGLAELPTIHDGHHQVEQDQGREALGGVEPVEGLLAVGDGGDAIPGVLQRVHHRFAEIVVVLRQQDVDEADRGAG